MRTRVTLAAATAIVMTFVLALGIVGNSHASAQTPTASYIVVFRDTVPSTDTDNETDYLERLQSFRSGLRFSTVVKGFSARLTPAQVQAIQMLPWVKYISPDYPVQATGSVPLQSGDSAPTGVRRIEAGTATTARQASSVGVAIIDTGIDLTHGAVAPGTYPLVISAVAGPLTHTVGATLVVSASDFSISVTPTSRTVIRFFGATSTTYTVTLKSINGYNAPVTMSVTGLGTGTTPTFTPNPVTPTVAGATTTFRVGVATSAATGSRTLTITGLGSDGKTHSVTVTLTIF